MPYVYTEEDPTVLVHYGRLGMKWGQHIFGDDPRWGRNSRGESKTSHLGSSESSGNKKDIKATNKERLRKAKKANQLSDEEINRTIDRVMRERQMKQLIESESAPKKSMIKQILNNVLQTATEGAAYGTASYAAYQLAKMFGSGTTRNGKEIPPSEIEQALSYVLNTVGRNLDNKTRRK